MPKFTKVLPVRAEFCHEDRRSVAFSFFCILRKRIRKVKFFSVSFSRYSSKQSGVLGDREPGFRSQVGARYLVQYLRILTVRLMKNQVCGGMDGWMDRWMDGWMDELMGGWMDGLMDGWMDGWMD